MYIDGQWHQGSRHFEVLNPATGEHLANIPEAGKEDIAAAIAAADRAFESWSQTTAYYRSDFLKAAQSKLLERSQQVAERLTQEQGKPLKAAQNEVRYAADFLGWYAEEAKRNYGLTIPSARPDQRFIQLQQPVGVVGAITPWNYPISMITRKLAPALAAGCTLVLKPAEATPLCAIEIFKIFDELALPPGVINLVTTENPIPVGDAFCTDPRVKKITFTGSTAVGRHLAQQAAPYIKRFSMELGGHAPFIVFADADPVHAAKGVALVKFLNTGQACISPNRIFVHRSIAEDFIATLATRISNLKPGNGLDPASSIGPLVNQAAIDKVHAQVQNAMDSGAKLHIGGHPLNESPFEQGHFYAPTLLSDVDESMLIYREETFGPVAPVILFDDEEEVIRRANDTHYGLAAYIYTQNLSRAMRVFERLRFGIIGINDINPTSAAAPFGGMNDSGLGREGAAEGLYEYLETKLGGFSI